MNVIAITIGLFAVMLFLLALGTPIAFALGFTAVIFAYFLWGPQALMMVVYKAFGSMLTIVLVAVPLFIFMGIMLEKSGIGDRLYKTFYHWFGPLRGGLAVGTVIICAIFAAITGISGAATVTMGVVALPSMLRYRYDYKLAIGTIAAGGALGILIPPSVPMVVYGFLSGESVGGLFLGGVLPGILLALLFIAYTVIRCYFQPGKGPAIPVEDRIPLREKILLWRSLVLPIGLILIVLGSIFAGWATPTEASALGAVGSLGCAAVNRTLNWAVLKEVSYRTLALSGMVMWIVVGGACFASIYAGIGGPEFVIQTVKMFGLNRWVVLIGTQISFFILGCLLDPLAILMITGPIYIPLMKALDFNILWFGILYIMNMEMAFLTPPFGLNLFYLKGIVPEGYTMKHIISSICPFVILQGVGLSLVILFPIIAMWLPELILGPR